MVCLNLLRFFPVTTPSVLDCWRRLNVPTALLTPRCFSVPLSKSRPFTATQSFLVCASTTAGSSTTPVKDTYQVIHSTTFTDVVRKCRELAVMNLLDLNCVANRMMPRMYQGRTGHTDTSIRRRGIRFQGHDFNAQTHFCSNKRSFDTDTLQILFR